MQVLGEIPGCYKAFLREVACSVWGCMFSPCLCGLPPDALEGMFQSRITRMVVPSLPLCVPIEFANWSPLALLAPSGLKYS